MRRGISVRSGQWQSPEKEIGFVAATRQKQFWHLPDVYGRQLWTRKVSILPTAPTALPLHGFDSGYSSSIDEFDRNF
jgi:hypothetical protein